MKVFQFAFVLAVLAAPAAAQDKVKFAQKFTANVAFYQQVSTAVTQSITVAGGTELKLQHSQAFKFKWLPVKQEGDKWTVTMTIEGMTLNIDIATNQVKYDSASTDGGNNQVLAEFFKKLKDTPFTVTFGKDGVVEKVEGRDEFLKNLGGANPQLEQTLRKILGDESLKEMTDPMGGLGTADEKVVGAGWSKKSSIPLGPVGSYERTLNFTYKGKDAGPGNENVHKVEVTPDMKYLPPPASDTGDGLLFRIKGGDLKPFNPNPMQPVKAGLFRYDAAKGYVRDAELSLTMKGTLTVALGNSTETTVELYQTQTTKIETRDSSFNVLVGPTAGPSLPKQ